MGERWWQPLLPCLMGALKRVGDLALPRMPPGHKGAAIEVTGRATSKGLVR